MVQSHLDSETANHHHLRVSWHHLFAFTRWAHALTLILALVATGCVAAFKTYLAIALGSIFDIIADFGNGNDTGPDTLHQIIRWCIILVLLGFGNWLANSAFLAFWIAFGELQAQRARRELSKALLEKEMSWFDLLDQGISSLLARIQT